MQLERSGQQRPCQADTERAGRTGPAALDRGNPVGPLDRPAQALVRLELRAVEDELVVGVRPEVAAHRAGRRQVGIGQGDRPAGDRLEGGRPVGQGTELADEPVAIDPGLAERRLAEEVRSRPPAARAVAPDITGLDLDRQKAPLGVGDHDVHLAVAQAGRSPAGRRRRADGPSQRDPADVLVDLVLRRQGGPQAFRDAPLGLLALGHRRARPPLVEPHDRPAAAGAASVADRPPPRPGSMIEPADDSSPVSSRGGRALMSRPC